MEISPSVQLYLQDGHSVETEAIILAIHRNPIAFDQPCVYPGGGGHPPDEGKVKVENGKQLRLNLHTPYWMI
jgi:Ser-tRNA(Ala) deacylase AlaX